MRNLAACCLLAILFCSCSKNSSNQETETSLPIAADSASVTTDSVITAEEPPMEMPVSEESRIFSDPTKKDTFRLRLTGTNLIDAEAIFTIQNPKGDTIWKETFPASELEASLVYEMTTPIATLPERQAFIRKRVHDFFDHKHFSTPALAPNDQYDPEFGDQVTWEAVKNDKNAVGFSYLLGKENGRRLAYSKLKNMVLLVGHFGR